MTHSLAAMPTTVIGRDHVPGLLAGLIDTGSYQPSRPSDGSGVTAGQARIRNRPVMIYATDPTVRGGALSRAGCELISATITAGCRARTPVLGLWSSGGAALQEGVGALDGVSQVFAAIVAASGRVPQISLIHGPAAGGAAYGPALTDVVLMNQTARVFVTGPAVVRQVTGQDVTAEQLGGSEVHGRDSGVAHVTVNSDHDLARVARDVVDLLDRPGSVDAAAAGARAAYDPGSLLPESNRRAYDIHPIINALLDEPGVELHQRWAANVVTTLGRLAGRAVGVVANNPLRMGGCLDAAASDKAARFVRMCDAFGIPLLVLVDVPGYLPGLDQERAGVVRRGAKLLHAFAECRVTRVTLVLRKAYGGAYIAMNSRSLGAAAVYAWPGAEIGVMDAAAAVGILHRRELAACADSGEHAQLAQEFATRYTREVGGLPYALELGLLDAVISPPDTRKALAEVLAGKPPGRGNHTNIPL